MESKSLSLEMQHKIVRSIIDEIFSCINSCENLDKEFEKAEDTEKRRWLAITLSMFMFHLDRKLILYDIIELEIHKLNSEKKTQEIKQLISDAKGMLKEFEDAFEEKYRQ